MATQPGRRRFRDSFGSRRVLAAFGLALLVVIALIAFALGGIGRGGASVASTTPAPNATAVGGEAAAAARAAKLPTSAIQPATPMPVNQGMPVKGVTPDNALQLPWAFYYDGSMSTIGAKTFSGPEMTPEQEVKLGPNSWLLLAQDDRVEVTENLDHQTVKVKVLSNKYDGAAPGVIGKEVYIKGWVVTGEMFSK